MDSLGSRIEPAPKSERERDSLLLLANLRADGDAKSVPVRIRNLSPGGLMAELPEPMSTDAPVEIEVRGIGWVKGRVAWYTEGRAGIAFDRTIDPHQARKPITAAEREARRASVSIRK